MIEQDLNLRMPETQPTPTEVIPAAPAPSLFELHKTKILLGAAFTVVVIVAIAIGYLASESRRQSVSTENTGAQNIEVQERDEDETGIDSQEENEEAEDEIVETPEEDVGPWPNKLEFSGVTYFSMKKGTSVEISSTFINHGIPTGNSCTLKTDSTLTNGGTATSTENIQMPSDYYERRWTVSPGVYKLAFSCPVNAKIYKQEATVTVNEDAPAYCDDHSFQMTNPVSDAEALRSGVVGTWRGCALTPFGVYPSPNLQYGVEITFNSGDTYTSRNYEKVAYPNTNLTHPVFYTDMDGDFPNKNYWVGDTVTNNMGMMIINLIKGPNSAQLNELKQVQVSGDGTYLRFIYQDTVYELIKVED